MKHNCSDPHSWYKTAFGLQLPNNKKTLRQVFARFYIHGKIKSAEVYFCQFQNFEHKLHLYLAPNKAANKMLNLKSVVSDLMFPSNFCPSLVLDFLVFLYRMSRCHSAPTRHNSNFSVNVSFILNFIHFILDFVFDFLFLD